MRPAAIITVTLLSAAAVWLESAAIITHAPFDFDDSDCHQPLAPIGPHDLAQQS